MEFFEFMFKDLVHFIGMCLLLSAFGTFVEKMWSRLFRYLTIRKFGYPPPHCNVDGTFLKKALDVVQMSEAK